MITRDDAYRKAESWINAGKAAEDRREVGLYEFPGGYVVWRVEPEPEDSDEPPMTVGGGMGVVDKETGDLSYWPSLPPDVIAQRYSARRG